MLRIRVASSIALIVVGVAIAAYPFLSVSRLQQQVLDEVPLPDGVAIVIEGKPDDAIRHSDFVLAFRGISSSVEEAEHTLRAAGFQSGGPELEGRSTFTTPCCGAYGDVVVSVFEGRDGITGLRYSVTDQDITATWIFINGFGGLLALGGLGLGVSASGRRAKSTAGVDRGQTPVSAI